MLLKSVGRVVGRYFSALDSTTAQAMFNGLFDGEDGILKDCGVILVTHAVHFLPRVQKILVMFDGSCSFMGTWNVFLILDCGFYVTIIVVLSSMLTCTTTALVDGEWTIAIATGSAH